MHFASQFADYPSLQNNLTLDRGPEKRRDPSRGPPPRSGPLPGQAQGHRPSRSQEEEKDKLRQRGPPPRGPPRPRDPRDTRGPPGPRPPHQSSPERRENRRPRRNSESSMVDKGSLPVDEERRRRERRKERDERAAKDGKTRRVRKPQGLDIIDKLDVSGIYGPSMIHHDGPYDAVQPHRNRKKDTRAPMHAFPKGSANNVLGGSGPVNKNIDLETFHGRGAEGFTDFGSSGDPDFNKKRPELEQRSVSFNPKDRADIIHGEESVGLGTSTFLEGAPASRTAIQQREIDAQRAMVDGGLGRKKSIAQRFRGISQPRRGFNDGNPRIASPEARFGPATSPLSAGDASKANESNPFFDDYNDAYDRKGATIKVSDPDSKDRPIKSPSSPRDRNPLTRAMTSDGLESPTEPKPSNGFLSRVKSLKGGRRPRPERPV